MRMIYFLVGWLSVGLGALGALLPLLPTVPFLLLAAFCFARSSDRFHDWLTGHPTLGPPIADWRENGAIRRRVKWIASASMLLSFSIPAALGASTMVMMIQAAALACVAVFIWTRPDN